MKKNHVFFPTILALAVSGMLGTAGYCSSLASVSYARGLTLMAAIGAQDLDVPFVPTPEEVAAKMLDMAQVSSRDLVYDLGCGDGRIVIMAAREKGARGVGFDLDPDRIFESNQNALAAGVADRVRFVQKDLYKTDLSRATVVTLYLLPSVNVNLRPRLFAQLKPGTRVVSHDFDMGDWEPDQSEEVSGHNVYYWVMPANASGTWEWTAPAQSGDRPCSLSIGQKYQKASGTLDTGVSRTPIRDVRITGDAIRFTADSMVNGRMMPFTYEGRIADDTIRGTIRASDGSAPVAWKARRKPATAVAICNP